MVGSCFNKNARPITGLIQESTVPFLGIFQNLQNTHSVAMKKSNFVCSRNQPHVPSDYNLQSPADVPVSNHVGDMGKCKTKAIQADLGIFTHIHEYSETIQEVYSELCVNLTYPKLWHIQNQRHIENPGIFRTGGILRTLSNIYDGVL